jgi:MFS family permease
VTKPGRLAVITLTGAQAAGQTGSWAALTAALPLALSRRDPALWLAVINAAWAGPALLTLFAGRLVDRYGPRRAGVTCWLGAAGCAAAAMIAGRLPVILLAIGLMSACRGVGVVAGDAAPTWIPGRPSLDRASAWLVLAAAIPILVGPLTAASVLTNAGPRAAWAVIVALFAAGAAGSALVPAIRPDAPDAPDALRAGRRVPGAGMAVIAVMAVTAGIWLTYGALEILQPLQVRVGLHAGLVVYGQTQAWFAIGSIVADLALLALPQKVSSSRWAIPAAVLAVAAGERLFTAAGSVDLAFAGMAAWGAGAAALTVASKSVLLSRTPAAQHGRVLSRWRAIAYAADLAPAAVVGPLTAAAGLPAVLLGTCGLAAACGLGCLVLPGMRTARRPPARTPGPRPADPEMSAAGPQPR